MKIAALLRSAALVTAVALIPTTTATMAQVDGRAGPEFSKLFATYQRIKASYVDKVEDDVLVRGAIDGMLAALDPHSAYLDGSALQRLETMIDGNYSGLGLSVVMEQGAVKVISPFRGSPADQAGVKAGDFITHLDGALIYGGSLDDAVNSMRGPAGTSIQLTIFRPGRDEPLEVDVTRGVITLEPVSHELAAGNIGVISVNEFSANVGANVLAAWQAIRKEAGGKINGLVLDLRNNPGGSLDESVALSDLFLTSGRIVSQRGRARGETSLYDARPGDMDVNPTKEKKLTNMRSKSADDAMVLEPPRLLTLESALEYIEEDELIEVTPTSIRLRKRALLASERKRTNRDAKRERA
jgi:carboxyl-terminal processing protease